VHHHEVAERVAQARRARGRALQQLDHLGADALEALLEQEAAVEHGAAAVGHARRLHFLP
jgi:hypothetical protein